MCDTNIGYSLDPIKRIKNTVIADFTTHGWSHIYGLPCPSADSLNPMDWYYTLMFPSSSIWNSSTTCTNYRCYSWFYHTWLITYLWPSLSLYRLFRLHGLRLSFDVPISSPKNPCLLLYMTFNPIPACTHDFWPQSRIQWDVCINPNIFWIFPSCVSEPLDSWPSIWLKIARIWPSITLWSAI